MGLLDLFTRGANRSQDRPATSPSATLDPLAEAEALEADGRLLEAVDLLAAADRDRHDPALEVHLVDLRRRAAEVHDAGPGRTPWPPAYDDPFPEVVGRLPEVDPSGLTPDVLGGAVRHHGSLVVRGLFRPEQVERGLEVIREAGRRRDADLPPGEGDVWYTPMETGRPMDKAYRRMVAGQGGTWMADSPAATARILDDLRHAGAIDAIAGHFGERPYFSLQKSTLRHSPPVHNFAGWHQDGSFLGPEVRAMNVWVALSACGGDHLAPALEIVPRRVDSLLDTDGGLGSASISDASVLEAAGDTPPVTPEFLPGDALLFDERLVHRTHLFPEMTEDRYALECWFFAGSHPADEYVSLVV